MTIDQKRALIRKSVAAPKMTQIELADWAAREFGLYKPPANSTASDILKNASKINDPAYGNGKRRKPLKMTSPALESRLKDWVTHVERKKVSINHKILTMKVKKIQDDVGGVAQDLSLSVRWLSGFMRRHGSRFRIKRGQAGSVDPEVVREGRRWIQELIDLYDLRSVFNMDEGVLCFAQAPVGDIYTASKAGVRTNKTRSTLPFTPNADGSELLPLLFIGRAARPRCFGKKNAAELGFCYQHNKNAWITSALFKKWLRELDLRM